MADTCPKCGHGGVESDKCPSCGVIIPLYRSYLEKMRRGPQAPVAAVAAHPTATVTPPPTATEPPTGAAPRAATGGPRQLHFHGTGGTLLGIHVVNALLTLVTLGVFYFWGKVRVRRYLFSQTEFEGDRFAYHGTGKELLFGFLKAALVFGVPIGVLNALPEFLDAPRPVKIAAGLVAYGLALVFVPLAMVGARRYRLSRTSWRGLRFSFRGPALAFVRLFIVGSLLSGLTLGLYYPFFITQRHAFLTSHSYFGNRAFAFTGHGRELLRSFIVTVLLFLPTFGLAGVWFSARRRRYFWSMTSFGGARFASTITGARLLGLWVTNVLLLALTLGLAWPWIIARNVRFTFANVSLLGAPDLGGVTQDAQAATATGEALSSFLDADFNIG